MATLFLSVDAPLPATLRSLGHRVVVLALLSLATPAHPLHHMPDSTCFVTNFKQLPDHLSDPIQGPVVTCISKSASAFVQGSFQLFYLFLRQLPRMTQWTSGFFLLRMSGFLIPAVYGAVCDTQHLCYFFWLFCLAQAWLIHMLFVLLTVRLFLFVSYLHYDMFRDFYISKISNIGVPPPAV